MCVVKKKIKKMINKKKHSFEKFKLYRNLQMILYNMMYNMSVLRHWFSNERWGGGGVRPEPPSSLVL